MTGSIPKKQVALHATIQVAPKDVEAYLAALRPIWECCASEAECLFFDVFEDPKIPGLFRFVEIWTEDQEWFVTKQMTKAYYGPYFEATKPLWIAEPKLEFFERRPGWTVYSDAYVAEGTKIGQVKG